MLKYLRDQRHVGTVTEIARLKFPFPNEANADLETIVNEPRPTMSVGEVDGKPIYPDIVVVRRPGQWLSLMAEIEMEDSVSDESARTRWLQLSRLGDLLLYVPYGRVAEAKRLCRKHGVNVRGIRTWRFRPVWGLDVGDA